MQAEGKSVILRLSERSIRAQAVSAAFHGSVSAALHPASSPVLGCPFLFFPAFRRCGEALATGLPDRLNRPIDTHFDL